VIGSGLELADELVQLSGVLERGRRAAGVRANLSTERETMTPLELPEPRASISRSGEGSTRRRIAR
jgi:hypothetical protein